MAWEINLLFVQAFGQTFVEPKPLKKKVTKEVDLLLGDLIHMWILWAGVRSHERRKFLNAWYPSHLTQVRMSYSDCLCSSFLPTAKDLGPPAGEDKTNLGWVFVERKLNRGNPFPTPADGNVRNYRESLHPCVRELLSVSLTGWPGQNITNDFSFHERCSPHRIDSGNLSWNKGNCCSLFVILILFQTCSRSS